MSVETMMADLPLVPARCRYARRGKWRWWPMERGWIRCEGGRLMEPGLPVCPECQGTGVSGERRMTLEEAVATILARQNEKIAALEGKA